MSVLAAIGIDGLSHDAHVADAGLFDGVHDSRKGAKGNVLIGTQVNGLMLRIANSLLERASNQIDVDRIVAEKNLLGLIDADYQPLFGDLFHRTSSWNVDFNPRLQYRRCDHENDEQDQHYIHQRRDVDIRQRGLCASLGIGEGHQRRASAGWGDWRSTRFNISKAKSSLRAASSRIEPLI